MSLQPRDAVIVDAIRTPMGRSKGGIFRHVRAERLGAGLLSAVMARNPAWDVATTEDVIWGCVTQTQEQGFNIARNTALMTSLPQHVPAQTVNRLCGSSMQALHTAAMAIQAGQGDIFVVGGVEHMGHVPMDTGLDLAPEGDLYSARCSRNMGLTAELLARHCGISRPMQDAFAVRSHQLAEAARQQGHWQREIVPTAGHDASGNCISCTEDEVIRPDTDLAGLQALKPVFDRKQGSITAGSSSALADGAAALLVVSAERAQALQMTIRARIRAMAVTGCEPALMGRGPIPASRQALDRAGLAMKDMEVIEFNEAFAAQALAVIKALDLSDSLDERINLQGGAIALGHPLGCSGARITTTLLNIMERQDKQLGLASMCIGLGQGISTILERV